MRRIQHEDRDRGTITLFVAILAVAIFAALSLVVDGARKLAVASHTASAASEAARAGSQQLSGGAITGSAATINSSAAASAARQYLSAAGVQGNVTVNGNTLQVTTQEQWRPLFLGVVGVPAKTITGHATVKITGVRP